MIAVIAGCLLIVGSSFALIAAIGLLRFPDLYSRTHAASKAGTLGSCVMILAIAVFSADSSVALRCVAGIVFFLLTAPVSSHLLARAAYCAGLKPWDGTKIDDLAGQYDERTLHLKSRSLKG